MYPVLSFVLWPMNGKSHAMKILLRRQSILIVILIGVLIYAYVTDSRSPAYPGASFMSLLIWGCFWIAFASLIRLIVVQCHFGLSRPKADSKPMKPQD
jgi:hypothetical protein